MTPFRFVHTSDLHLGKRFGRFDEEVRGDLQQARQGIVARLAEVASDHQAGHVLIGGDMFDTETPSARVVRQALSAMGEASDVAWWIIPGNHDSGAAEPLWAEVSRHAPPNVRLLQQAEPVEMEAGVWLLPAPCSHRFPGQDLTAWMGGCITPEQHLRIGLAHGGVIDFGSDEGDAETIAANRAATAHLDYLALGDWHGDFTLNARTRYSGTPERDRFKHAGRGSCLVVEIAASGQEPQVQQVEIGAYDWRELALALSPEQDAVTAFQALLPESRSTWRSCLLRLRASGWVTLPQRLALAECLATLAPEFCFLELVDQDLRTEHRADDLDQIARSGALRVAAENLQSAALDQTQTQADRDVAAAALNRLYGYAQGAAQ